VHHPARVGTHHLLTRRQQGGRGTPAPPTRRDQRPEANTSAARQHRCSAGASDTSPNYDAGMSAQRRPPDVEDEFLTVAEVAASLQLNQQTIRNWIGQGSLAALRVGCCRPG
jgi:excisionase family DNA binding protein